MKKINIIGNEKHGSRYRDAALFYPTVQKVGFNDTQFSIYDTIILAEPFSWNDDILKQLENVGFCGSLIMEKMPFNSMQDVKHFYEKAHQFRTYYAMLRLYEDKILSYESNNFVVRWPNLYQSQMSKSRHTLPNALLFCYTQFGMDVSSVKNFWYDRDGLKVELVNDNYCVNLIIYDTADNTASVQVNGENLRWPNYLQLIHRFFDAICTNDINLEIDRNIICDITNVLEQVDKKG